MLCIAFHLTLVARCYCWCFNSVWFFFVSFKKLSINEKYANREFFLSNAKTSFEQSMLENDVTFRNTLFLICSLARLVLLLLLLLSLFHTQNTSALTPTLLFDFPSFWFYSTSWTINFYDLQIFPHSHTHAHIVQSVAHFKWSFAGKIVGRVWYSMFAPKKTSSICLSVCCRPF